MPPLQNSYVCSEHFSEDSFEVNLLAETTGRKCKRRLKADAVPSKFSFQPATKKPRLSSENRSRRRSHQEAVSLLTADSGQSTSTQSTLPPTQVSESENVDIFLGHENNGSLNSQPSVIEVCHSMTDSATQCCFDPVLLVSVATQTDDVPTTTTPGVAFNIESEEFEVDDENDDDEEKDPSWQLPEDEKILPSDGTSQS
ncbi:hypothetical protein ACROYT_G027077 [Oculina patagonica]